jgi:hypothetical protein
VETRPMVTSMSMLEAGIDMSRNVEQDKEPPRSRIVFNSVQSRLGLGAHANEGYDGEWKSFQGSPHCGN